MSEPTEGSAVTPGVKKQTRRFAPVKRGGKSAAAQRREAAAAKEAEESADAKGESASDSPAAAATPSSTTSESHKSTNIGTIRPEGTGSGRLQSINDGQKSRGSTIKMKFKPTIPHKRNKKEVSSSAIDEALSKPNHNHGERGGRGRGRGGRGRGRGRGLVIVDESTASGIFSLGPSAVSRGRPGFGGGGGGFASYGGDVPSRAEGEDANSDMVEMFTNSVGKDTPVTFKHVSRLEGDIDPVTLHQTIRKIPWMTVRSQKKEKKSSDMDVDGLEKVKDEPTDTDMDTATAKSGEENEETEEKKELKGEVEEEEEEETVTELPKVLMDGDSPAQNIFALDEKQRLVCVAEEELLYFQLPTVVPKFEKVKVETADTEMADETKIENESQEKSGLPVAAQKSSLNLEEAMANMGLEDMPDGQIGKLIIYKSGKMKMKFGNVLLDVNQGMQSNFLENIMVVDHESEETKKAIELGHIVQKFICAPNMDALLDDSLNK